MKWIATIFLAVSMLPSPARAAENANDLFQQALAKERTEGNLPEAIKLYQSIVNKYASNRKVAAQALLQLSECQSKLGDAQSRKSLERLVREFADQKDTAAEASRRLAALTSGTPKLDLATRLVWTPTKNIEVTSILPDGRMACYTDWDTGNLGLHDFASGSDRALTDTGNMKQGEWAAAEGTVFSRDGKQIAYTWHGSKVGIEIRVASIPASGFLQSRRLFHTDEVNRITVSDWSSDGKWLLIGLGRKNGNRDLALMSTQDASLRVLKSGADWLKPGGFSPDGKFVAYLRGDAEGVQRAYTLSVDGKSETLLSMKQDTDSTVWTPDGSRIVLKTQRPAGLWSIRIVDGKPQGQPELLDRGFSWENDVIDLVHDGTLFYRASLPLSDIYVGNLDPATGKLASVPKRVNMRAFGFAWGGVEWLPDGKSLSFWNRRNGRDALMVHSIVTGEERELWDHDPGAAGPGLLGWFPDGRTLLSWRHNGKTIQLRREDAGTREVQASWDIPKPLEGSFSRDLMTQYVTRRDEKTPCERTTCTHVVRVRELQTGQEREIFRINARWVGKATVSPDSREIAILVSSENGPSMRSLLVAPVAGGPSRELYSGKNPIREGLDWTADGKHVLAFYDDRDKTELWSFPTAGGPPEKSALQVPLNSFFTSSVSPDGSHIAFVGGTNKKEVWVMTGLSHPTETTAAR